MCTVPWNCYHSEDVVQHISWNKAGSVINKKCSIVLHTHIHTHIVAIRTLNMGTSVLFPPYILSLISPAVSFTSFFFYISYSLPSYSFLSSKAISYFRFKIFLYCPFHFLLFDPLSFTYKHPPPQVIMRNITAVS